MANLFDISDENDKARLIGKLCREIQSANINFLIGAGCTFPAIPLLGHIEQDIQEMLSEEKIDEAEELLFAFLKPFLEISTKMLRAPNNNIKLVIEYFQSFLMNIYQALFERKSSILSKRATIFSTNYDLFIERAFEEINIPVNLIDGFKRNPAIVGSFKFSSSEFFNTVYNSGNLYNYRVEIPSINLVKLHGSLSWLSKVSDDKNEIIFSTAHLEQLFVEYKKLSKNKKVEELKNFNNKISIVFPKKEKFKDTLLNQTYYDLLRIFANELDKENTLLIVEGFSFADEHILDITKRALKNPTLTITIFSYDKNDSEHFNKIFSSFNNVDVIYDETNNISFDRFNSIIKEITPNANI